MKSNLIINDTQKIALYNNENKVFIYFELDKDILSHQSYEISISCNTTLRPNMKGILINKSNLNSISDLVIKLEYINGIKENNTVASFCIEQDLDTLTSDIIDDISLTFKVKDMLTDITSDYNIKLYRRFNINPKLNKSSLNTVNINNSSHMLIRTNPKLSGNIKLVVGENYDLYIDTFPVTPILSKKEVRKKSVSALSHYYADIYNIFSKIPASDIFKLNDYDTYDISLPKREYSSQYTDTYTYGAYNNNEGLYEEKISILAPLWIENTIPDFFIVFRLDESYSKITYDKNASIDELLSEYIKKGKLVKSWSLKNSTPIGKYLNTHLNDLNNIGSNVFISFDDEISNSWAGIPINNGIMSELSETNYEFNKLARDTSNTNSALKSFTDVNNYVTEGFSRNSAICPNLINLQFNFDDKDTEDFKMYKYFGLYVTSNQLFNFNYYDGEIINNSDATIMENIEKYNILEEYNNRIFGVVDNDTVYRVSEINDLISAQKENTVNANKKTYCYNINNINEFITLNFEKPIEQGEHYIINVLDDSNIIFTYEAYAIGKGILGYQDIYEYCHISDNKKTIAFCVDDEDNNYNVLFKAFEKLFVDNDDLSVFIDDNKLSFFNNNTSKSINLEFITNELVSDLYNIFEDVTLSDFTDNQANKKFKLYGFYELKRDEANIIDFKNIHNFEIYGNRIKYNINSLKLGDNKMFTLHDANYDNISEKTVYKCVNNYIKLLNINELCGLNGLCIINPITDGLSIFTKYTPNTTMGYITLYNLSDFHFNIFSINQIKDFDFTVYDTLYDNNGILNNFTSSFNYNRSDDYRLSLIELYAGEEKTITDTSAFKIISGKGKYKIDFSSDYLEYDANIELNVNFNTFTGNIHIIAMDDTIITSNDDSLENYNIHTNDFKDEEDIENYKESKYRLKYGLTTPYICKWVLDGIDSHSNNMLLKTNNINLKKDDTTGIYSNYIPTINGLYDDEICYPSYKYMNNNLQAVNSYVYYDINDLFYYDGDNNIKSLKDIYLDTNSGIDVFSTVILENFNDIYNTRKFSKLKYNKFYNNLDTVFKGVKMSIDLSNNIIHNSLLDGYNFSIILCNSKNKTSNKPFELFINNIFNNVLLVWYTNAEQITYTDRHKLFLSYKNFIDGNNNQDTYRYYFSMDNNVSEYGKYNYSRANFMLNTTKNSYEIIKDCGDFENIPYVSHKYTDYLYQDAKSVINNNEYYTFLYFANYDKKFMEITDNFQYCNNYNNSDNYLAGFNTYGDNIVNDTILYNNPANIYVNNVSKLNVFMDLIQHNNNISVYCINKNGVINSNNLNNTTPLRIKFTEPKIYNNIYTHSGWFKPLFNNILEFSNVEDSFLNYALGLDLTFANTIIKRVNNFKQYWFHRVKENINNTDIENGNAIDYRVDFSPMFSQWDNNYYINYDNGFKYVNGYINTTEKRSYFSSKVLKIPNSLICDNWDTDNIKINYIKTSYMEDNVDVDRLSIGLDISNTIKSIYFNSKFIDNWRGLPISNIDDIVGGYIDNTILPMYETAIKNLKVDIYTIPYNGNIIQYDKIDDTNIERAIIYESSLDYNYGNYIYNIIVPKNESKTYYIKVTLN